MIFPSIEKFWELFGEPINEQYILQMLDGEIIGRRPDGCYYVRHKFFMQYNEEKLLQLFDGK